MTNQNQAHRVRLTLPPYRVIRKTGIINFCILFILMNSCEEKTPAPKSDIVHVAFSEPKSVFYNHPAVIDLDGDSVNDFSFTVGLFMNGNHVDQNFAAVSLQHCRIRLTDVEITPHEKGAVISGGTGPDDSQWSIETGKLLALTIKDDSSEVWGGPWTRHSDQYMAVSIRRENANHFGWVRIRSDLEGKKLQVVEYAFNSIPESSIEAGQID